MQLNFNLHEKQMEVFTCSARFRVVAAGRRFGKTFLSAVELLLAGMDDSMPRLHEIWYIAPTYGQAKDIMWDMLNDLGRDLIKNKWQNELTVELINGRKIKLKGSDKPDTLRGSAVGFVVLDEFASMKPEVWDLIIRPALADTRGRALFIGTPDGLNHFYGIWKQGSDDSFREWASFMFNTLDNPIIDEEELVEAAGTMTQEAFAQEFEASFQAAGGGDLRPSDIIYMPNSPEPGSIVMTIDPAGYGDTRGLTKSKLAKADETAIAIAEVSPAGWFYHEVIHGRWDIRETSLRIVRAAQQYRPTRVGVESGALSNAVMPYIVDQQKRLNTHFKVWPLKHGGKKKQDRIMWSLQGRLENGRIFFKQGMDNRPLEWHKYIIQQMNDFPNPMAHDDGIDSMAYTDQLASTVYHAETIVEDTEDWDDTYWEYE